MIKKTCPICDNRLVVESVGRVIVFMVCRRCNAVVDYYKRKDLSDNIHKGDNVPKKTLICECGSNVWTFQNLHGYKFLFVCNVCAQTITVDSLVDLQIICRKRIRGESCQRK